MTYTNSAVTSPSAEKALKPGSRSFVIPEVASSSKAGSFNCKETLLGPTISSLRIIGNGINTSKVSISVSNPHDSNFSAMNSAFCLLQGEPT